MKNIIIYVLLSFVNGHILMAQATSIILNPADINSEVQIIKNNGMGLNHLSSNGSVQLGTYVTSLGAAFLQTHTNHNLNFRTNNTGLAQLTLATNGNFGVGVPNPTANLHVDGFTKLGFGAPAIKMLKITGTTASVSVTLGATTNYVVIPNGIPANKILSVSLAVDLGSAGNVFAGYTQSPGYEIDITYNGSFFYIWNIPTNSANILSKPFKLLVTYKE